MTAACCKEIKAGSVKWLKSAGATWVFTFFFLSLFQREWAERESESSADRAPVHASSFIFDNIHGGIGLLWIWSEIFQRGVGVGLSSVCVSERWSTPGSQPFLWLDEGLYPMPRGPPWLICSLFNDWPIAKDNILWARLFLAKPPQADLCVSFF